MRECANALENKPLTACLAAVMILLLVGPVTFVVTVSVIGLPVVRLLWCGIPEAGLIGRIGIPRWIGGKVMPEKARGDRLEVERPLGIRLAALNPFYMVPALGFASWTVSGVVGLGAAATTILHGLPREHAEPYATPDASSALASGDVRPVAPFASRLGAVVLDIILVTIVSALPDLEGGHVVATFLADHVVVWTRKRTSVGSIISQPGVTRTDGDAVLFIDALMRSLATIFRSRGETGSGSCGMRIGRLGTTRSRAPM